MALPPSVPGIPGFEDGGNMLRGPGDVQGATVEQDEDDGFAGGYCGFEELLLFAGEIERGAGGAFAAHALELA